MLILACSFAAAQIVIPTAVVASSTYPTEKGVSYAAANLVDGRAGTAWIEGDRGSGLGASVELQLGAPHTVRAVEIWSGYQVSGDMFVRHNRPKDVELSFSDGNKQSFTLKDVAGKQVLTLTAPVSTTSVRVRLRSVFAGSTFGDTPISELRVLDTEPDPPTTVATAKASSTLPPDADSTYAAAQLVDGLTDTLWCTKPKKGDGRGESLTFAFAGPTSVSGLTFWNGDASDADANAATSSIATMTLRFDDGTELPLAVAPTADPQPFPFPTRTTASVVLTVTAVTPGAQWPDLCVSEARFTP